jgi:ATP-dependent Lon protease
MNRYPVLPLRDIVVFPHMIVPLFVGRTRSVLALDDVMQKEQKKIVLVTQKNASKDDLEPNDLYEVATLGTILQLLKLPDGTVKVLVEGNERIKIKKYHIDNDYFEAEFETIKEFEKDHEELQVLIHTTVAQFEQYVKVNRKIPPDILVSINQIDEPAKLVDTIASYLTLKIAEKQDLLEIECINERLEKILGYMEGEISTLQLEKKIRDRVKRQMEKTQREYYLNEQMKAIQKELNDGDEDKDEFFELEERIRKTKLSKDARIKAEAEVKKLKNMNAMSAEATVIRNYLDWLLGIPWNKRTKTKNDIKNAENVLERDHFGLEKVKERILEYLSVQGRVGKIKSQILCLVGPPGVGKTSLGKSIAEATGREFVRMSLGGVRDEAEIRGHRRTYIGSMPGKVIQSMKKAKVSNPLFLLDEIDKLGSDWRGDPSSALLEVLDPEQNATFSDHYLEVDYDLSDVMFIATANTLNMPQPLMDRMEIIRLSGYTEDEKINIAHNYLLKKQLKLHGLKETEIHLEENVIRDLIRYYTREAGVRSLEREIAKLCRKVVKRLVDDVNLKTVTINTDNLKEFSGIRRFSFDMADLEDSVGVSTGLAWTEVGGDILFIETTVVPGKGQVKITGKLGDVMQESAQAALSFIRSKAAHFGLNPDIFEKKDIHIHVPEGATPKDGPSAGIALCTSILSALSNIPVRKNVAMTGEITLRGRVLQIGGLKEKLLAAHRSGLTLILIPKENEKDLEEIPDNIRSALTIIPVSDAEEALKNALVRFPKPWEPDDGEPIEPIIKPLDKHPGKTHHTH